MTDLRPVIREAVRNSDNEVGVITDAVLAAVQPYVDRLDAAEKVALMFGISPARHESDREKAAYELWLRWLHLPGVNEESRRLDDPEFTDEAIAQLARQRDETRQRIRDKIDQLVAAEPSRTGGTDG